MSPPSKRTIVRACIIYSIILLNPPWINAYTQQFLGFSFIFANDFEATQFAKIDIARLFATLGLSSLALIAIHLALTSETYRKLAEFILRKPILTDEERRKKEKVQDLYFRAIGIAGIAFSIAFIIYSSSKG